MSPPEPTGTSYLFAHPVRWLIEQFAVSETAILITLAMGIGLVSGLGVVVFHYLVELTHALVFTADWLFFLPAALKDTVTIALAPAAGALVAGTLVWVLARYDHSHGTSGVMEAVALHGGRLAARPFLAKIVAAGVLIGSGGSAGPEDPSVQIGAVVGSTIGKKFRLTASRVNTLVTAGVASAIATAFNAPIAGVFFALEIVAGDFSSTLFAPVVLAAVVASIVGRKFLGTSASFAAPPYTLVNPLVETPLYALLGLVAAVVGIALIRSIFLSEQFFDRFKLPLPARAGLGGGLVGLLALFFPDILGSGYEPASNILHGTGLMGLALLVLLLAKFVATSITLGSARVGGTFAPSMVLGAMVGGLFGEVVHTVLPAQTGPPAAYALVGMGAMLTAVVRAPITAVLLLFEVTGDYHIILAIMASVVSGQVFAHRMHIESIYTERLARRGIQLRYGRNMNILELITVGEAMTPNFTTVPQTMTLLQLEALFDHTHHHGFPVLDDAGRLAGMVTLTDLRRAAEAHLPVNTTVEHIATRDLIVAHPEQPLATVLHQFAMSDVGRLPVVDPCDPGVLLGVVRRSDIVKAYRKGALQRAELEHRYQHMRMSSQTSAQVVEVNVLPGGTSDGHMVRDIHLPGGAIITSIRREDLTIIPRGDTVLHGGDHLTILAMPDQAHKVEEHLLHGEGKQQETAPRYYDMPIPHASPLVGKMVRDVSMPEHINIASIQRDGATIVPRGDTVLQGNDLLIILLRPDQVTQVQTLLKHGAGEEDEIEPRYATLLLGEDAPCIGKKVTDLDLPPDVLIVTLRRDDHVQAVHGDTVFATGDELTILTPRTKDREARQCLSGE